MKPDLPQAGQISVHLEEGFNQFISMISLSRFVLRNFYMHTRTEPLISANFKAKINSVRIRAAQCIDKEILISKNGNIDIAIEIDKRMFR